MLTRAELDRASQRAIDYWRRQEPQHASAPLLSRIAFEIVPMANPYLGLAYPDQQRIEIDVDAAGFGWNRVDLYATLVHEIGHLLGHDHDELGGALTPAADVGVVPWVEERGGRYDLGRDAQEVVVLPKAFAARDGRVADMRPFEVFQRPRDNSSSAGRVVQSSSRRETAVDEVMAAEMFAPGLSMQLDDDLLPGCIGFWLPWPHRGKPRDRSCLEGPGTSDGA
jgi:hypothetical protein